MKHLISEEETKRPTSFYLGLRKKSGQKKQSIIKSLITGYNYAAIENCNKIFLEIRSNCKFY